MSDGAIRYARNGDVSVAHMVFGEGALDLVFVNGFVNHLEIGGELPQAMEFFARLGAFARVICFDKRGMGLSDRDSVEYTIEGVAEDILAVLDDAECERAVIFGVSEGGSAATYFAATHPDRVSALVVYGSYARLSRTPENLHGLPVDLIRRMTSQMVAEWGDTAHLEWFAPSWHNDRAARAWWGRMLRAGTSPGAFASVVAMYENLDVSSVLSLVRVPTLVLWRADDTLVPAALSRAVAEGIPNARGVELPGDDHLFLAGDQAALLGEVEEFLTGSRRTETPERALSTVLFTDIVGSTELAAEVGDARWRELLSEHDRIARLEIDGERGRLVKSTGDGVLATFDGPARAIAAARAMRRALTGPGLEIRAGIHTGECELLGSDLGGIAVHIGARVSSAAGSGEVLVSQTVRDLVVGSGLEFEDRGAQVLKGVPGEWRLFAVVD